MLVVNTCTLLAFRLTTLISRRRKNVANSACSTTNVRVFVASKGPKPITDASRFCEVCGVEIVRRRLPCGELMSRSVFLRRKFCSRVCEGAAFASRPKKANPGWMTAHHHARNIKPTGPCERCGAIKKTDVHHKDGNWRNNALDNLERLCRSCHVKHHKREGMCGV